GRGGYDNSRNNGQFNNQSRGQSNFVPRGVVNNYGNRQPQHNAGQMANAGIRSVNTGFCEVPIEEREWSGEEQYGDEENFEQEDRNEVEYQQQCEIGNPEPYHQGEESRNQQEFSNYSQTNLPNLGLILDRVETINQKIENGASQMEDLRRKLLTQDFWLSYAEGNKPIKEAQPILVYKETQGSQPDNIEQRVYKVEEQLKVQAQEHQ
ncbi:MAG: hypothetical protein GY816_12890, partial [Cytophagales bacterium]|nr:hypothetical protein [Cytophagales bacterium]